MQLTRLSEIAFDSGYAACMNVGINLGKAAGAASKTISTSTSCRGVRDTNFMTAVGETRVAAENLNEPRSSRRFREASRFGCVSASAKGARVRPREGAPCPVRND